MTQDSLINAVEFTQSLAASHHHDRFPEALGLLTAFQLHVLTGTRIELRLPSGAIINADPDDPDACSEALNQIASETLSMLN